jgi:hypothetical protein
MSTLAATTPSQMYAGGGKAAKVIKQADDGIGNWLLDLVSGTGSSPAHIIITGILGVVPGVGQVLDVRDIIVGVIAISKNPHGVGGWVELVITLIGCVPAIGDALKVGFKLMKQGHSFGRVLEAASPKLRGNIEKYMRNIDWGMLAQQSKSLFKKTLDVFIDGIDSWAVKWLAGGSQVKAIVGELRAVQKQGPKMVDEAFAELKKLHSKMLGHDIPRNTAALKAPSTKAHTSTQVPTKQPAKQPSKTPTKVSTKPKDTKTNPSQPGTTKNNTKKKAKPKKQSWLSGVPAEHITDYYAKKKHINFKKANNQGKLIEETTLPHNGIDHLWNQKGHPTKPFVVGETKSSIFDSLRLMAALPAEMAKQFDAIRADEEANPVKNGKPNVFDSEARDGLANQRTGVDASKEPQVRGGVNKPDPNTGLPTQMSHAWIAYVLRKEKLTLGGEELAPLIRKYKKAYALNPNTPAPYKRWISLVTGRQLDQHKKSGGKTHNIQHMLDLPDSILED